MKDTKQQRKDEILRILLASTCPSHFLIQSYAYLHKQNKIFNYSELARRGGFASRSHLRQLVVGEKNITKLAFEKLCKAFDIIGTNKKYFSLLCESHACQDLKEKAKLQAKLSNMGKQILGKKTQIDTSLYELTDWPLIYASLGSELSGATITEIQKRSRLEINKCQMILDHLEIKGLTEKKNNRYYPLSNHIALNELGSDDFFKNYYLNKLEIIRSKAEHHFTNQANLHFQSTTCISSNKLKQFREELRDLLLEYIDNIEDNEGDITVSLLVSFYEN